MQVQTQSTVSKANCVGSGMGQERVRKEQLFKHACQQHRGSKPRQGACLRVAAGCWRALPGPRP